MIAPGEVRDEVGQTLVALKEGLGVGAAAVFDDDLGRLLVSSEVTAAAFWESFAGMPCLAVDWGAWYRELRLSKQCAATCPCPAQHQVHGFLVHDRWALLVLAAAPLPAGFAGVLASAVRVLANLLPIDRERFRGGGGTGGGGGGGPDEARLGIPLWWFRRS